MESAYFTIKLNRVWLNAPPVAGKITHGHLRIHHSVIADIAVERDGFQWAATVTSVNTEECDHHMPHSARALAVQYSDAITTAIHRWLEGKP